jgi:hypothetical protein
MARTRRSPDHTRSIASPAGSAKSFLEQYLNVEQLHGHSPDERFEHLRGLVNATFGALSQQVEPDELFGAVLYHWARLWVKIWTGLVCAPPRSRGEAAVHWDIGELQFLASVEFATWSRAEAADRALTDAIRQGVTDQRKRRQLLRDYETSKPAGVSKFIDDNVTWFRTETRPAFQDIVLLLPDTRPWRVDPHADDRLVTAFRNEVPTTAATAWRFVVNLQRCRAWSDLSINDELKRAEGDKTSKLHDWWVGLMWLASVLWQQYRTTIEQQAKAEGKIPRETATRESRVHLLRLHALLAIEAPAVRTLRSKRA